MTTNPVPKVPEQNPGQQEINLPRVLNPYNGVWWTTQTVTDVPENLMGWLVAQGFEVTNIRQDRTTNPPTNYFSVRKDGLQPKDLLLSLCNSYTINANDARTANEIRYNQIVRNWTAMIDSSHTQFDAQVDEQNHQSGIYLADLDTYMTEVDTLIEENRTQVVIDSENAKDALDDMLLRLGDLETNAANNAVKIEAIFSEQDNNYLAFVSDYDAKLIELDQNFAAYLADMLAQIAALGTLLDTHVADYSAKFDELLTDYNNHESEIETQIAGIDSNVNVYVQDVDEILNRIQLDYNQIAIELNDVKAESEVLSEDFIDDYDAILQTLDNDHTGNATVTRGLLNGLGQTELARINEQFASSLSSQMQMMVSRGLYMSTIPVDITARNTRDKDENIQTLNDRLNREKVDNEHRIYEQKTVMRSKMLDGTDRIYAVRQEVLRYQATIISQLYSLLTEVNNRLLAGKQALFGARDANFKYGVQVKSDLYGKLMDIRQRTIDSIDRIYQLRDVFAKWKAGETGKQYEQIQQIEAQYLESIQRQYAAKQEVSKIEMSERDVLLNQLQTSLTSLNSGKERYAVLLMQNANTLAEHRHRAIIELMNTSVQRLDGWKSVADEERKLMAYQLDERNKLLIGLYSFVERREDIGPEWKDMTQIIAGLGDSAGGWLSPS
jgi:truncated hemoglobin YjbI